MTVSVSDPPARLPLAHEVDFSLGEMLVRPSLCEVEFGDVRQHLEPRVMQVLVSLAQARPAVLTRDDLIACCWGGVIVGDDAINRVIGKLRRLSESTDGQFVIETLPRVGYRLFLDGAMAAISHAEADVPALQPDLPWTGGRPTVVLLPFEDSAGDDMAAFVAEETVAAIFDALGRSSWMSVVSRRSVPAEASSSVDTIRLCAELGVQYLISGNLRVGGDALRVAMNLVDGRDDELVWSGLYRRPLAPDRDVDVSIASQAVNAVETALLRREQERILRAPPPHAQHWDLFMRGRWHIWRSTRRSNALGQDLLLEALKLKADDVPTMALLVFAKVGAIWAGWVEDPAVSRAETERLAMRAVATDPSDAFAHFANGAVLALSNRLDRAIAEQRRALELNPHFDLAAGELGRLLVFSGKIREAETHLDRAIAASPNSPQIALWTRDKAVACFIEGRHAEAATYATEACAKRPNWFLLHYFRAACLAAADRMDEAYDALAEGRGLLTPYPFEMLRAAHPFTRAEHMTRFLDALRSAGWND